MFYGWRSVLPIAACAAMLAYSGCGGEEPAAAPSSGGGPGARSSEFTDCLKENGVELPEGGGRPPGDGQRPEGTPPADGQRPRGGFGGDEKTQKAFQACRDKLPEGARGGPPGGGGGAPPAQNDSGS